jgi:HlyD family secretion protein
MGDLKMDTPVKFQIDAYNYNQWGWATGKIKTIGNDIELIQNQAVFQVQCSLNENELFLKNGISGKLKKGMTVKAQFFRARRSLWQLLFDKVDDWFNPMLDNLPQT